jgi:AraC-like DNA-binding protein
MARGKVAAVSQNVGYASEAAFNRTFKKTTGVSPANWRRKMVVVEVVFSGQRALPPSRSRSIQ